MIKVMRFFAAGSGSKLRFAAGTTWQRRQLAAFQTERSQYRSEAGMEVRAQAQARRRAEVVAGEISFSRAGCSPQALVDPEGSGRGHSGPRTDAGQFTSRKAEFRLFCRSRAATEDRASTIFSVTVRMMGSTTSGAN